MPWKPKVTVPACGCRKVFFCGAAGDFVAISQPGEVRDLEQELADEGGEVGLIGIGAGQGLQAGNAATDLVVPVGVDVARCGAQEQEPPEAERPVFDAGGGTAGGCGWP
jgi:hypothetical protein